ncbi:MAG: molybdenum ABC transporter ATP-binding protein [Methylovirgula sp.]
MIDVDVARQVGSFNLKVAFRNAEGITALFGRSGSGKSLTIGLIGGLDRPDRGHVILDGRTLVDTQKRIFVPAHRRRIGIVFQDSRLFPHFGVRQNLLFGRWFAPRVARAASFDAVIETLGIGHLLGRAPAKLSGGERQRVAIGRAFLSCPKLLLMDEPLAALDAQRRSEILPLIERLRDEFKIPIVYVSHDIEEVSRLANRVVVLERGQVVAVGDPAEVLPAFTEDARTERASVLAMRVGARDEAYGLTELMHPAGTIWLAGAHGAPDTRLRVVIKATDVTLSTMPPQGLSIQGALKGRLAEVEALGPLAVAHISLDGDGTLLAMTTRRALDRLGVTPGQPIFALVKTAALDERFVGGA